MIRDLLDIVKNILPIVQAVLDITKIIDIVIIQAPIERKVLYLLWDVA
jgi:hypothetical protein